MMKHEPIIKIENIVASGTLKHGIDLNAVVKAFPSAEYSPEKFPGVIFRLKKPRTATLIFHSGKMVCTGAGSEREARKALMKVVRKLKKSGIIIVGKPKIKIQNVVASASLPKLVDLAGLYEHEIRTMRGRMMYEPEQFPGLIYRMNNPHVVILLFASGKIVCTGAKNEEEVHQAVNKIHEKLEEESQFYYKKVVRA